ncbi:MAG: hypothetical protein M1467_00205 [Deltaproteobacteria bacterium]|nr:hypothetical protein [Deltaproteobacteria bacterium]
MKDTKINTNMIQNADRNQLDKARELVLHSLSKIQLSQPVKWVKYEKDGAMFRTIAVIASINEIYRGIYGHNGNKEQLDDVQTAINEMIKNTIVRIKTSTGLTTMSAILYIKKKEEIGKYEIAFNPAYLEVLQNRDKFIDVNPISKIHSLCGYYLASYVISLPSNCSKVSFRNLWNNKSIGGKPKSKRGDDYAYKRFCHRICKDLTVISAIESNRNCRVIIEGENYIFKQVEAIS